jgi:PKD repeat protein
MGKRFTVALAFLVALALSAACGVHQTEAPALSGPSELAMSVVPTAIPDSISQDGASQSSIMVLVRVNNARPIKGLAIRLEMSVGGTVQDFGTLSSRTIVTGSDGKAFAIYTAPPAPPPSVGGSSTFVQIVVRPIGTNAQVSSPPSGPASIPVKVDIRLVPPGVILAPAGTPTASFSISPTPVVTSVPVTFDASNSTPGTGATSIASYAWTFGDGTTGTGRTVTHTFTTAATFNVTVTVTNDRGLSASSTVAVTVGSSSSASPTAAFVFSPTAPAAGQTVLFNADQSQAATGRTITQYSWNFGDGAVGSGSLVTHGFTTAGTYSVTLSVFDDAGQKTTVAQTVTVSSGGGSSGATTAKFTFSPSTPSALQSVFFNASSSSASTGHSLTTYAWDFGDGTAGSGVSVTHVFTAAGTFTVTLTVTDDIGQKGTIATPVTITSAGSGSLTAEFSISPTDPVSGQLVTFNANLSSPVASITSYDWDFGDGTVINGQTGFLINHTYFTSTGNNYTIRLTVHDNTGRVNTTTHTLPVIFGTDPIARFTVSPSPATITPTVVTFDGSSSTASGVKTIARYTWDFGDNSAIFSPVPPTTPTATHSYAATGSYVIRLTVTDSAGLSVSTTRTLLVQ